MVFRRPSKKKRSQIRVIWPPRGQPAIPAVTRCNFPGKLERNSRSTLKRCKLGTNVWCEEYISKLWWKRVFANFISTKSRIALQVARKIAPCNRVLIHVCLAYLFLHLGQVLSSFKCYFKRKYLNLIDSNCDVDESCTWFFYRDCPCQRPWMYYQYICDIGEEKSLWDGCSSICSRVAICCVSLAARNFGNGRVVLCTWDHSIKWIAAALGGVCFFLFFVCILYNIIIIQYNLIL